MQHVRVSVELSHAKVAWIDRAVSNGLFESREAAIRGAINGPIGAGADQAAIAEAYRRAYAEQPEDEAIGGAGVRLLREALEQK